ncbi:MAG: ABC transporter permease, partial [Acidobacteriaceae bacterium]|nr:ABC transporter permease [Acidobacteriaceae bacterium]
HSQAPEEGHTYSNGMNSSFSYPLYRDLNAATSGIFQGILAFRTIEVSVTGHDNTETAHGELVSGNFFSVLKVAPWRGRLLAASDDTKIGGNPVVVLSYGLWQRDFGGNGAILNHTIELNRHPYVVIGIAPPQFYGTDFNERADLFVPMRMKSDFVLDTHRLNERLDHWASLIARLQPRVSSQQAAAALGVVYPPLRDQDFAEMKGYSKRFKAIFSKKRIDLSPGGQGFADIRDQLSNPLKILMVMVALVLLITIVNVANLLIARGVARKREMAIRLSVGAGRAALMRQLIVESLLLALIGGSIGVVIAYNSTPLLLHLLSFDLSQSSITAQPDWRVLLFTAGVTLVAGVAFGVLPSWQSSRTDVAAALKAEGATGHTGQSVWLRRVLVVGQVALSLILVTAAILFTRSLQNLKNVNVGFDTARLVKFSINPLQAGYSQAGIKNFAEDLRQRLTALPDAEGATIARVPLLQDTTEGGDVTVEGTTVKHAQEGSEDEFQNNSVSPGYFTTMRIPLLAGRQFRASDSSPDSKVVVVNDAFVKRFLPGKNAIGMHLGFGGGDAVKLDRTIIGVVADSKHSTLRAPIKPFVYQPYLAEPHLSSLTFYVRVRGGEQTVMPEIRALVHRMDASLPVNELSSMTDIIDESLFVERGLGFLSIGFAVLATLLAVVGLYGVMSYSVTRRYRELGIRMAIGASPESVLGMVLRESAYLGIAGVLCAIPCVMAAAGTIRSALYGVKPGDPTNWMAAAVLMIAVALFAGFIPAWNAARIDPHTALRSE